MWIDTTTRNIYKIHSEIRAAFPQISLPIEITDDIIESLGLQPIMQTVKPEGKIVIEHFPKLIDNQWVQQWEVREPFEYETEAKSAESRLKRNRLLTESDWTQVKDAPVDQEAWAAYRQELRDITQQPGFPWETNWPSSP